MGTLPPVVWMALAVAVLVVGALCAITIAAVVRAPARQRIARWPARLVLGLLVLAAAPWLVVVFAPITIRVSIHGLLPLLGWILVALLAFALLVLLPVAVAASGVVWWTARRRR